MRGWGGVAGHDARSRCSPVVCYARGRVDRQVTFSVGLRGETIRHETSKKAKKIVYE